MWVPRCCRFLTENVEPAKWTWMMVHYNATKISCVKYGKGGGSSASCELPNKTFGMFRLTKFMQIPLQQIYPPPSHYSPQTSFPLSFAPLLMACILLLLIIFFNLLLHIFHLSLPPLLFLNPLFLLHQLLNFFFLLHHFLIVFFILPYSLPLSTPSLLSYLFSSPIFFFKSISSSTAFLFLNLTFLVRFILDLLFLLVSGFLIVFLLLFFLIRFLLVVLRLFFRPPSLPVCFPPPAAPLCFSSIYVPRSPPSSVDHGTGTECIFLVDTEVCIACI